MQAMAVMNYLHFKVYQGLLNLESQTPWVERSETPIQLLTLSFSL